MRFLLASVFLSHTCITLRLLLPIDPHLPLISPLPLPRDLRAVHDLSTLSSSLPDKIRVRFANRSNQHVRVDPTSYKFDQQITARLFAGDFMEGEG